MTLALPPRLPPMNDTHNGNVGTSLKNKPIETRGPESYTRSAVRADGAVTYTLKVLSVTPSETNGAPLRTVLFQRIGEGEAIEISAEIESPDLLAQLPEFLDAALEIQKALWPAQR